MLPEESFPQKDVWVNKRTGEEVEGYTTVKRVGREKFEIIYFAYLFDLIEQLGNKKLKVLKCILENKSYDNTFIVTTRELAKKANVSYNTVIDTLKLLKEVGVIKTRIGSITLNPRFMVHGTKNKEDWLFLKFEKFDKQE